MRKPGSDPESVAERLQELLGRTRRRKHVQSIVLGVASVDASFRWTGAAGLADSGEGTPMRVDTPFPIASVTKMFTAAAVMILQERGRLALDDGISRHLPGGLIRGLHRYRGQDFTGALTVRHLIAQTSGFRDYFLERPRGGKSAFELLLSEGDRAWELEDVVRYTRDELRPVSAPAVRDEGSAGTPARVRAHYSDTNYKLLGAILESAAEQPLHRLFEEMFFEPLELRATYLYGHPRAGTAEQPARVYHKDRPFEVDQLLRSHGPEGGIVSTVDDLLRFGRAFMSGELFASPGTLAAMQRWNPIFFPIQYGYGLMRFKLPRLLSPFGFSPELVGHSGSSGSFLFYCGEIDLYIAGTINQMAMPRAPYPLMVRVAQLLQGASRTQVPRH